MLRQLQLLSVALCLVPVPAAHALCPGDLDGDGTVGITDFLSLLGEWGAIGGPADLDNDGVVGIQDFLLLLGNWGPCPIPAPYPAPPTIVVYNENYPDLDGNGVNDALQIAEHYVSSRGLDASALCGVRLPTGNYATPAELLGARATIVEQCICSFVSPEVQQSSGCDIANAGALESIRDGSPITHMVLIKGIPIRLFAVNWPDQGESDTQGPSFGFYLSYLAYHSGDIFTDFDLIENLSYPSESDSTLGYVPPIDPAQHRMLAHGYVEAMTTQRTIALIDRTLAAERAGVQGNILLEDTTPFFFDLTSTHDSACVDYLSHEPFKFGSPANSWPWQFCRVGTTASTSPGSNSASIPGATGSTIPFAINAGLLEGRAQGGLNGFSAFDGFHNMVNWHTQDEGCVELCRSLPTRQERDDCRTSSTDFFKGLDTDCVGVAPGFMAHQVSSFGVQYYGFTPPGWLLATFSSFHKSMPLVLEGDAFVDGGQFTDNRYAHFGVYDHLAPDSSMCGTAACPARIAVTLSARADIDDVFIGLDAMQHTLKFRYRYAETPGQPAATMFLRLEYSLDQGGTMNGSTVSTTIADSAGGWNTVSQPFSFGPVPNVSVTMIRLRMWSSADENIAGFLDIDGVELVDAVTQANVLAVDIGSFTHEAKERTEQGDWAANVIDRLGGIACWGTSSHHFSGASETNGTFEGAFFAGRTLGEATAHANSTAAGAAGIVYGDPLYRPSAVKLYASGFVEVYQHDHIGLPGGYDVWNNTWQELDLRINVLHGTDNLDSTRWEVSTCPDIGVAACDGQWTSYRQGTGAVRGMPLDTLDAIIDVGLDQTLSLKLRVWNEADEGNDLTNYAYFKYWAHALPECPADGNSDGVVNEIDEAELLSLWGPDWFCSQTCPIVDGFCIADVDRDGVVGILDWLMVSNNFGDCEDPLDCPIDVNSDGVVDALDLDLVEQYWNWGTNCPLPYEDCPIDESTGFCVYDLDQDGDVDEADHQALIGVYWGPCSI